MTGVSHANAGIAALMLGLMTLMLLTPAQAAQDMRCYQVDASLTEGTPEANDKEFFRMFGSGHAYLGLRPDWRSQLQNVNEMLNVDQIRFHAIFDDDVGPYIAPGVYNWTNVDNIYDYMLSVGVAPYVELSFMPDALASGNETVFYYKGNITPPKNWDDWTDFISSFVKHLIDRYGDDLVRTWNFEVWNEPNCGFYDVPNCCGPDCGNKTAYFTLYNNTVHAIKAVDDQLMVGGPSTAQLCWIPDFLNFVQTNKIPFDFVSSHLYPTDPEIVQDNAGFSQAVLDAASLANNAGVPFYLSEYNSGLGINVLDMPYSAAFIAFNLMKIRSAWTGTSNVMSYWTFSDVFEEGGFDYTPFHEGYGIQTIEAIPKPAYRGFQIMNNMYDYVLPYVNYTAGNVCNSDELADVLVTVNYNEDTKRVDVYGVTTNFQLATGNYSGDDQLVNITFGHCPSCPNNVTIYRIDEDNCNPKALWIANGSPMTLNATFLNDLMEASQLVPQSYPLIRSRSAPYADFVRMEVDVPANGVVAFEFFYFLQE